MKKLTCAFTGPRPQNLPFRNDESIPAFITLMSAIDDALTQAIRDGYRVFISGGAMGVDLWCAERVVVQKEKHPYVELHFCLPCEDQADKWQEEWRERYFNLLAMADKTTFVQRRYTEGCMLKRNRIMVDSASRLIAVVDESKQTGGTAYTVRYARSKGCQIVCINPYRTAADPQAADGVEQTLRLSNSNPDIAVVVDS